MAHSGEAPDPSQKALVLGSSIAGVMNAAYSIARGSSPVDFECSWSGVREIFERLLALDERSSRLQGGNPDTQTLFRLTREIYRSLPEEAPAAFSNETVAVAQELSDKLAQTGRTT